jgi:hypothetical protein
VTVVAGAYEFILSQNETKTSVHFHAKRADADDMTESDEAKIGELLKEMGKWEGFAKAAKDSACELGILSTKVQVAEEPYDPDRYEVRNIKRVEHNEAIEGTIALSKKERWKRNALAMRTGQGEGRLEPSEISAQVANIDKWRNLRKTVCLLLVRD